jgi:hypothetical protein
MQTRHAALQSHAAVVLQLPLTSGDVGHHAALHHVMHHCHWRLLSLLLLLLLPLLLLLLLLQLVAETLPLLQQQLQQCLVGS